MTDEELALLPLADIAALIQRREISVVEVIRIVLRRIDALGPVLRCYIAVRRDDALREALAIDAALRRGVRHGPLTGIPISFKDNIAVLGVPTTMGSPARATNPATADAVCVKRLRAAGAIVIAKANMWELACTSHNPALGVGATRNAWDLGRESGGSSSGSGAAVAAGLCYASIATDGGGSIRIPAAMNGVVGLKPTFGRTSMGGVISHLDSLDHVGPLTRTALDASIILDVLASRGPRSSEDLDRGVRDLRIGVIELGPNEPLQENVRAGLAAACRTLSEQGAHLVPLDMPSSVLAARDLLPTIAQVDGAEFYQDELDSQTSGLDPDVRRFLEAGRTVPVLEYVHAQRRRRDIRQDMNHALSRVDVLVLPTTPWVAPPSDRVAPIGEGDWIRYTAAFNLTGHPAVAIPCGFDQDGLPISMQIVGRIRAEATVLRVAHTYQRMTDWHRRRPVAIAAMHA